MNKWLRKAVALIAACAVSLEGSFFLIGAVVDFLQPWATEPIAAEVRRQQLLAGSLRLALVALCYALAVWLIRWGEKPLATETAQAAEPPQQQT